MKNLILVSALVIAIVTTSNAVLKAAIGVGVGTGKIVVNDLLKPGQIYDVPVLTVLNTGDETSNYVLTIDYHEQQPELRPKYEWFTFQPNDFELQPGQAKSVKIKMNLPINTVPGKYFAYLGASPVKKTANGSTSISVSAASKFYFTVAPANMIQGIYYRSLSIWNTYEPWSSRATFLLGLIIAYFVFKRFFNLEINLKKK